MYLPALRRLEGTADGAVEKQEEGGRSICMSLALYLACIRMS